MATTAGVDNIVALPGFIEVLRSGAWVNLGKTEEDSCSWAHEDKMGEINSEQSAAVDSYQFQGTMCRLTATLEETTDEIADFLHPACTVTKFGNQDHLVVAPGKPKGYLMHNDGERIRYRPLSNLNASASSLGLLIGNGLVIGEVSQAISGKKVMSKTITIVGMMTSGAGFLFKSGQQSRITEWSA